MLTRGSAPGRRWGLCPQTPVIGSCSALAIVPPQPLTPSAAYGPTVEKNPVGAPAKTACAQKRRHVAVCIPYMQTSNSLLWHDNMS